MMAFFVLFLVCLQLALGVWFWRGGLISRLLSGPLILLALWFWGGVLLERVLPDYFDNVRDERLFLGRVLEEARAGRHQVLLQTVTPFRWVAVCSIGGYESYEGEYPVPLRAVQIFQALGEPGLAAVNEYSEAPRLVFRTVGGGIKVIENGLWLFNSHQMQDSSLNVWLQMRADELYDVAFDYRKRDGLNADTACFSPADALLVMNKSMHD